VSKLQTNRVCKACGSEIPKTAIKCVHCNSYQNWRRHVSIGNSTLALIVALVAVLGSASETLWGIYKDYSQVKLKKLEFALVELSEEHAGVLISNRSNSTIAVTDFQCVILLPFNQDYYWEEDGTFSPIRPPYAEETIGSMLFTYRLPEPLILATEQQSYSLFFRRHITPAKPNQLEKGDDARSICSLSAKNEFGDLEADVTLLDPNMLTQFDALEMVKNADYSPLQLEEKEALIREIETRRNP